MKTEHSVSPLPSPEAAQPWAIVGLLLLVPSLILACPVCRPKVQAAIHTHYPANMVLVLLPVAVLLVLGLALYWAESLWPQRFASSLASPHTT